jgi:protein phosphatase
VLRAFGVSDKGRVRQANEDCFAIHEDLGLCIVADGMGGHKAGEIAAQMAVDVIGDHTRSARVQRASWPFGFDSASSHESNLMRTSILLAHLQILETSVTTDECAGMGTTVVAAHVVGDRLTIGHVGDSRVYLLAAGKLRRLTDDDSWLAAMLAHEPAADPERFQHHPMRHALTNVVGRRSNADVHIVEETLVVGDLLLLTTDGVHGVLEDPQLEELMTRDDDPKTIAKQVVDSALLCGTRDNCTAVVARYMN